MKIKLQTINLQVTDPRTAKEFYVDTLGMNLNPQRSHGPDFLYLESDGCHLTLARRDPPEGQAPSRTMELGFEVEDVAALQNLLAKRSVGGFKPQKMGWGDVIEGQDPDGNRVILYRLHQRG